MRIGTICPALVLAFCAVSLNAQEPSSTGPYRVLKTSRVGGEGGYDYVYADVSGRRLYIPRGGQRAQPATDSTPARAEVPGRITVFDLETLAPLGEIANSGGQGVAVDPKSGHGFSSSPAVTMFDTKSLAIIKQIPVAPARPDGILFDPFNRRVYIFSHPTRNATVINAADGTVLGTIDLGGVPEEAVSDGHGTMYVVMQDSLGSVTVVDTKAMRATGHYSLGDRGRCNGLALDAKRHVLFAACAQSGNPPADPPQPMMVVLSATNGTILDSLPLAGRSDGAVFNPATDEAFSTGANGTLTVVKEQSPTHFELEEDLKTMDGARTITLDTKTNRIFTISLERNPPPAGAVPGTRAAFGTPVPGSFTILMIGR